MGKLFKHKGQAKIEWRPVFDSKRPNSKSCVPAPTSKIVKAEGNQSWGGGIGNNINNIANGVNSTERGAIAKLDATLRRDRHKRRKDRRTQKQALVFHGPAQYLPMRRLDVSKGSGGLYPNLDPQPKADKAHIISIISAPPTSEAAWDSFATATIQRFRSQYR